MQLVDIKDLKSFSSVGSNPTTPTIVDVYPVDAFAHAGWVRNVTSVFENVRKKQLTIKSTCDIISTRKQGLIALMKTMYPILTLSMFGKQFRQGVTQMLDLPYGVVEFDDFILVRFYSTETLISSLLSQLILPDVDAGQGVVIGKCDNQLLMYYLVVEFSKKAKWVAVEIEEDFAVVIFSVYNLKPVSKIINL